MKKLGFVDPFMVSPAIHCFNDFVKLIGAVTSYHMPSKFGVKSLEDHRSEAQGYIVVGSASHVTEPLDWHGPLAQFLLEELHKGKPVLGCCFGHQLLAHALGSTVEFAHQDQQKYTGFRKITITRDACGLKAGEAFNLKVSHRQVVKTLGPGLLETGVGLPNDIITHETLPLLLTQAHPEASSFFCKGDAQELASEEEVPGRKDGARFIQRFFQGLN